IRDVLDVNLVSNLRMTRAALGLLERGNEPVVINVSSVSAHSGGYGGVSVYVASKGAILSLTRSLAKELAPRIRVNGIAPGVIMTDLHREHSTPDALESIRRSTPLARLGRPEDCAGAAVFLASPAGAFVTGETIEVNGGLWMA